MTANQITKQLIKAGFNLEGITVGTDRISVYVHTKGYVHDKNEKVLSKIVKQLKLSGNCSHTQYGCWTIYINSKRNEFVFQNID